MSEQEHQKHEIESPMNISDISSENSRCNSPHIMNNYCVPLTAENVRRHIDNNKTWHLNDNHIEWGDNFDFSFTCEPSTSDNENDGFSCLKTDNNNISPVSSYELQSSIIPTFKIDPPASMKSSIASISSSTSSEASCSFHINKPQQVTGILHNIVNSAFAAKVPTVVALRRSISDPICRSEKPYTSNKTVVSYPNSIALNNHTSYDWELEPVNHFELEHHVKFQVEGPESPPPIHKASVVNLTTLYVSLYVNLMIYKDFIEINN